MAPVTKARLKKHLSSLSREQLEDDISELFAKIPAIRDFYQLRIGGDDGGDLLTKYKQKLDNCFFGKSLVPHLNLAGARKVLSDYKKISTSPMDVADLMLSYVELSVKFTKAYGDIDEPFYESMERMFARSCEYMAKHGLRDTFELRCYDVVTQTDGMGWGFNDALREIFTTYFQE